MVERSLSMREAPGSIPGLSTIAMKCICTNDLSEDRIVTLT